jgi:hypothetical protein
MKWKINEAFGTVVRLWCMAQKYGKDGVLPGAAQHGMLTALTRCHPRVETVLRRSLHRLNMVLTRGQDLVVNDWDEHNQWARRQAKLAKDRQRKRSKKQPKSAESRAYKIREDKIREEKSLKTRPPLGGQVKGTWKVAGRKDLANAVVMGNERERNGNRMPRTEEKALYACAMKIVSVIEDLEITPQEYLECVRFHATAVYGKDKTGYKQTWGAFAGAFGAIIGEIRRTATVSAGERQQAEGFTKWLQSGKEKTSVDF